MVNEALSPVEYPEILKEVIYKKEGEIAYLPILESLPLFHGFSWGPKSKNMSSAYARDESVKHVEARTVSFLKSLGMQSKNVINALGVFEGTHPQIMEVSQKDAKDQQETNVKANFIYTKDSNVTLSIRPGDCNVSIIYAKDGKGRDLVGLIHSSAYSTNMGLPRLAIRHLIEEEGVDPLSIVIGIIPGVSKEHYSLSQEANVLKNPNLDKIIVERNWKNNIFPKNPLKGDDEPRPVDILGATIMQFEEEGISPQNIQAYGIDTYEAAARGEAFSKRHSDDTGKPQGRILVAVQLKPI